MNSNNDQEVINNPQPQQTIIVNNVERRNGIGTAGFVLAIIGLVLCWLPVVNWIVWFLGFLFSFIGLFRKPKGLAIAGFIISLFFVIVMIVIIGAIGAASLL